jgi:hypothetical protein
VIEKGIWKFKKYLFDDKHLELNVEGFEVFELYLGAEEDGLIVQFFVLVDGPSVDQFVEEEREAGVQLVRITFTELLRLAAAMFN